MTSFSRRAFLAASTAALSLGAIGKAGAQSAQPVRIGVVLPSKTGATFVRASVNDFIGEEARMGAVLADSQLDSVAEADGFVLQLQMATSPTVDAAIRAGERLVETGNICALIGGVGEGQAEALAEIASRAKIPFFNIGETSDLMRKDQCSRYVFHVEASDAMYVDALGQLAAAQGYRNWYVVADQTERGQGLLERANVAAEKAGCTIVGSSSVREAQSVYYREVDELALDEADVVLVLIQAFDQFPFILAMEEAGIATPLLTFPYTITQTRDYISAARYRLPRLNPSHRVALWETTNPAPEAEAFNERIRAQWGEGADPTAWATFHAIKIVLESVIATGSIEADTLIAHLEKPDTTFDLLKGPGVSFRPWDHQLRQPLYGITVDQEAEWHIMDLDSRIGIARFDSVIPSGEPGADAVAWLDTLGDSSEGVCGA